MDAWDSYFQSINCNSEELAKPRKVDLKFGTHKEQFQFTVKEYLMWYISELSRAGQQFSPKILGERWLCGGLRDKCGAGDSPYSKDAYFLENLSRFEQKIRVQQELIGHEDIPSNEWARDVLLFEDEELRPLNAVVSPKIAKKIGEDRQPFGVQLTNLGPYGMFSGGFRSAGKIFNTGRRLIVDSTYQEYADTFVTQSYYGQINLGGILPCFNAPYLSLDPVRLEGRQPDKTELANTIAAAIYVEHYVLKENIAPFVTKKTPLAQLSIYLIGPDKECTEVHGFSCVVGHSDLVANIENEFAWRQQPTDLTNLLGMQLFAAKKGFLRASGNKKTQHVLF